MVHCARKEWTNKRRWAILFIKLYTDTPQYNSIKTPALESGEYNTFDTVPVSLHEAHAYLVQFNLLLSRRQRKQKPSKSRRFKAFSICAKTHEIERTNSWKMKLFILSHTVTHTTLSNVILCTFWTQDVSNNELIVK